MKRTITLAVCAAIFLGLVAIPNAAVAQREVIPSRPENLDFESVTVDESSVTQITDLPNVSEVQVTNDTDQDVCIAVDAATPLDCVSVSITCDGGANHTILKAGKTKSWPIPLIAVLCAKAKGAITSGKFYVEERDQ